MAVLTQRANMTLWLQADALPPIAGSVGTWGDSSGNNRDFAADGTPTLLLDQVNGRQVIDFDGVNDGFHSASAVWSNIIGVAAGTIYAYVLVDAISSNSATINNNDAIIQGDASTAPGMMLRSSDGLNCWDNDGASKKAVKALGTGNWHLCVWNHGGGSLHGAVDDVYGFASAASGNSAGLAAGIRIGRNYQVTSEWFDGKIAEIIAYNVDHTEDQQAAVSNYLFSKWGDRGDPLEQARDVGMRHLWPRSRSRVAVTMQAPPRVLDAGMNGDFAMSHPLGVHPLGQGWGPERPDRRPLRLARARLNMQEMEVGIEGHDLRSTSVAYAETGIPVSKSSAHRVGMGVLSASGVRVFHRDLTAWVQNPNGLYVALDEDVEKFARDGTVVEIAENIFLRTSFVSGTTGLTLTQTGGATVAVDSTDPLMFESGVTVQGGRITSGSSAGQGQIDYPATASLLGGVRYYIVIFHVDRDGVAPQWQAQSSADQVAGGGTEVYFDDSSGAFVAANTWNSMPVSADGSTITAMVSKIVPWVNTATLTLRVRLDFATAGASKKTTIYHVNGSKNYAALPSVVVNDASNVGGDAPDYLSVSGIHWPTTRGTFLLKVRPLWSSADQTSAKYCLFEVSNGDAASTSWWSVRYDASTQRWEFYVKNGGSSATAYIASTFTKNVELRLAGRWTSSEGELGLPANTLSIFVNGVKGVDAALATYPSVDGPLFYGRMASDLGVGGVSIFGAQFGPREVRYAVMRDEEIRQWAS